MRKISSERKHNFIPADSEHEHSDSEREDDDIKQVLSMESDHISLKEPTVTPSTSKPIKTFDFQWLSEFVKGNYK